MATQDPRGSFPSGEHQQSQGRRKRTLKQASHPLLECQNETIITEIRPDDVLFGRGFQVNNNQGNMRYRELLRQRKAEYSATIRRQRKHDIAREIVDCIYMKNGRFLQKVELKNKPTKKGTLAGIPSDWKIVDTEIAIEKAKQALRDYCERKTNQSAIAKDFGTTVNQNDPSVALPRQLQHPLIDSQKNHSNVSSITYSCPPSLATGNDSLLQRDATVPGHSLFNSPHSIGMPRQDHLLQPQQPNLCFLALAQQSQLLEARQIFQNIFVSCSANSSPPSFHQGQMLTNSTPVNSTGILELIKHNNNFTRNISATTASRGALTWRPVTAQTQATSSDQDLVSFIGGHLFF